MAGKKGMKHAPHLASPTRLEELRRAIEAGKIIKALNSHVIARKRMGTSQVQAGLGLLRKIMPDMQHTEHAVADDFAAILGAAVKRKNAEDDA